MNLIIKLRFNLIFRAIVALYLLSGLLYGLDINKVLLVLICGGLIEIFYKQINNYYER